MAQTPEGQPTQEEVFDQLLLDARDNYETALEGGNDDQIKYAWKVLAGIIVFGIPLGYAGVILGNAG